MGYQTPFGNYIPAGLRDDYAETLINLGEAGHVSFNTTNKSIIGSVNEIYSLHDEVMFEPTGVSESDRENTTMTFDDLTRTFTISPDLASFSYYVHGKKYTKTTPQSIVISNTEGLHYIYFDGETLGEVIGFNISILKDYTYLAVVYWDATNGEAVYFGDERHGFMDWQTHRNLHLGVGTRYIGGLDLADITVDASGDVDSSAQFSIGPGNILDEDIMHSTPAQSFPAYFPIYYREGINGEWRKDDATAAPIKMFPSGRAAINEWTGTTWQQTQVANNDFFFIHILATNDINNPIIALQGTGQYTTAANARAAASEELRNISGLPFQEFVNIATLIYQTGNGYDNQWKSRIRSTSDGSDYIDFRQVLIGYNSATNLDIDTGFLTLSGITTDDTETELFISGISGNRFTVQRDSTVSFVLQVIARDLTNSDGAVYHRRGAIKNSGGNITLIQQADLTFEQDSAWDLVLEADNTNEAMAIKVVGEASNSVKWVARIDSTTSNDV